MTEGSRIAPLDRKRAAAALIAAVLLIRPVTAEAQQAQQPQQPTPASAPATTKTPTPEDQAKNMAEAKSRYKAGLSLYDDGAFDAARVQFERAYELAPSYRILYNIGLVYKQLNEFTGALKSLTRYLKEGGAEVPPDRRDEVNKLIDSLKAIVATATVTVNVPGADVTLDDEVVGQSPLPEPLLLNPGRRKIGVTMAGRLPETKVITVASGDNVNVAIDLKAVPKAARNPFVGPTVIAWGATGVLAFTSGILAFFASQSADDLQKKRDAPNASHSDLRNTSDDTKRLAACADIGFIATIIGAGVGTYFTFRLIGFRSDDDQQKDKMKPTLQLGMLPTGAVLGGTF